MTQMACAWCGDNYDHSKAPIPIEACCWKCFFTRYVKPGVTKMMKRSVQEIGTHWLQGYMSYLRKGELYTIHKSVFSCGIRIATMGTPILTIPRDILTNHTSGAELGRQGCTVIMPSPSAISTHNRTHVQHYNEIQELAQMSRYPFLFLTATEWNETFPQG